jgi:hypothetical protein
VLNVAKVGRGGDPHLDMFCTANDYVHNDVAVHSVIVCPSDPNWCCAAGGRHLARGHALGPTRLCRPSASDRRQCRA